MKDPIVIDPPGFDPAAAWKECHDFVEQCGGIHDKDGETNWRAAFGADPGCCHCPKCKEYYWMWGRIIQCSTCGFKFHSDWWPAYSSGVQVRAALSSTSRVLDEHMIQWYVNKREKMWSHPYFVYGYEHPVDEPWEEKQKIDWEKEMCGAP